MLPMLIYWQENTEMQPYDEEWILRRHIATINMVKILEARELGLRKPGMH